MLGQEEAAAATPFDKLSAGADVAKAADNPMGYLKANAKPLMYAAGPAILAAASAKENMPKTVTQPGMIRPYSYNPYSGGFVGGNPYEAQFKSAANGGLMGMAAGGMAGYGDGDDVPRRINDGMAQGGMYEFAQRSEPVVRMAEGGILKMAGGTPPAMLSDEQLYQKTGSWEAAAAARDQQNRALNIFNDAQRLSTATYVPPAGGLSNVKVNTQAEVDAANAANPFSAQNMAKVDTTRPGQYVTDPTTGKDVALTTYSPGFDPNNDYAQARLGELAWRSKNTDTTSSLYGDMATPTQKAEAAKLWANDYASLVAKDIANKVPGATDVQLTGPGTPADRANAYANFANILNNAPVGGADKGLAGLNQNLLTNQNQGAGLAALIPDGASYTNRFFAERGLGFDPIDRSIDNFLATYKTELAAMTPKQQEDAMRAALNTERMNEADVIKATGKTIAQLVQAKRNDGSIIVPGKLDEVPVGSLPGGVSGAGNTVVNANGTITTSPDLTGLTTNDVRKLYTEGGGSLGYTSPTFASLKAVEDKYPLKGGSKQSYDYLMGRTDYDPTPFTKTGEVMKPYAESVLGMKLPTSSKMYLFDPATKTYKINPDYAIPTYDSKGVKSTTLTNKDVADYVATRIRQSIDFYNLDARHANNLSVDQSCYSYWFVLLAEISKRVSDRR